MAIPWGFHFATGITEVDNQHQALIALANDLERAIVEGRHPEDINDAFEKLADYAEYHFALEEALMREAGIDEEHADGHRKAHQSFTEEIKAMWGTPTVAGQDMPKYLLGFLTTWIYRHILITDHDMARRYYRKKGLAMPSSVYRPPADGALKTAA